MSDRLSELRRQRALVQQQADWLDREIAACAAQPGNPVSAPGPAPAPAVTAAPLAPEFAALEAYTPDPAGAKQQVKRGCLLYFIIALAFLIGSLIALFYFRYSDRPMLFMEKDAGSPGNAESVK